MAELDSTTKDQTPVSERLENLRKQYAGKIQNFLIGPSRTRTPLPAAMLALGAKMRENYTEYPILGGAVHTYIDLASTREFTVSGKLRAAAAAMEWLNNAESVNPITGMVDYGFDQYLRRRAKDALTIGAITFIVEDAPGSPLEYADPTLFMYNRDISTNANGVVQKARPEEYAWLYAKQRNLRVREVGLRYPIPSGSNSFTSPMLQLMPTATLSWLIQESDRAAVDGRRIRDIIFVNNPNIRDAVEEALLMQVALWSGGNPDDIGIPLVALNGATTAVKDMFARLGLSEVPPTLDREKFEFSYVNEIAAALGLALRHFWNNERTTNRALEVVQEQRQQQKGPASFVRSEQRQLNRSGILKRFGGTSSLPTRMAFVEESDASSMKERAEVLKLTAEAFGIVFDKLGLVVTNESFIAWLQSTGTLPYEVEFTTAEAKPAGAMLGSDAGTEGNPNASQESSDPAPTPAAKPTEKIKSLEELEEELEAGEVMINSAGSIVAKREKSFSLNMLLDKVMQPRKEAINALVNMPEEEYLEVLKRESHLAAREKFKDYLLGGPSKKDWVNESEFDTLSYKVLNNVEDLETSEEALLLRFELDETDDDSQ